MRRPGLRRLGVGIAALALGVAACGSSSNTASGGTSSPPTKAAGGPQNYTVHVDAHQDEDPAVTATAYYPKQLSAHPGDTVSFKLDDSGEPHTVALGALVNTALAEADKINPDDPNAQPPPDYLKIPQLFPQGPGDAIQAGAQPCVVTAGDPPTQDACPTKTEDAFAGTETLVGSGWMTSDQNFDVKLGDGIKPGTYRYFCQLHGPDMQGAIKVVDAATSVPSPDEVAAQAASQRQAELRKLAPAIAALGKASADKAIAGFGSQDVREMQIDAFGPKDISIPVGGSVTWTVFGDHSIAFNAPADAQKIRSAGSDGAVHVNQKAGSPAGGPGTDPNAEQPPAHVDGGTWDGNGFRASGLFFAFPPDLQTFTLKFSKAGTYKYICQIHEDMAGTVHVG